MPSVAPRTKEPVFAQGRSPDLGFIAFIAFPVAQWLVDKHSSLTVAGAVADFHRIPMKVFLHRKQEFVNLLCDAMQEVNEKIFLTPP